MISRTILAVLATVLLAGPSLGGDTIVRGGLVQKFDCLSATSNATEPS